ncbi:MAG: glutamyl-tRNA reductase [Phycisphaerae bacterium]|nr:glutamyl-tRNA reductase [Phycisphaerae bacterium]
MEISVIGASFHTARVARRERLALDRDSVLRLLGAIRREAIFPEAVVVSTCNRTEVVTVAADAGREGHLLEHLGELCGGPVEEPILYRHRGLRAVTHVFRVAAALDSQVVGEHEILGQLKDAYRLAVEAGTAGFLLHKLMHRAFRVGKRVQSETGLGQGRAGLPHVAATLAGTLCGGLAGRKVLLLGAGKAGELAAAALLRDGATHLIVANRTPARAAALAEAMRKACGAAVEVRAIGLEDVPSVIGQADVVLSSTGAGQYVLTRQNVAGALRHRRRAVVLVDLGVPRDIDPALGELANVRLVNLDDLQGRADAALGRRKGAIPAAETIVRDEAEAFCRWLDSLQAAPLIKHLRGWLSDLQRTEIDRLCREHPSLDRRRLDRYTRGVVRKVLHGPITYLKRLATEPSAGADLASLDLLRRMFDLEDDKAR